LKTTGGKKRSQEEATGSAAGSSPSVSPPRPNPNQEWKKSKAKTKDLLALLNSGFLREKEVDMWCAAAGDPYPMEKNPYEIPMFTRFAERGLALPVSDFFKGLLELASGEAPTMAGEERDDILPESTLEVVVHSPKIQDAEPIRSALMSGAATSIRGGVELLADDLVDPAAVARHMEAMRQAEQWMKVSCRCS
jgi:hypothetical protein